MPMGIIQLSKGAHESVLSTETTPNWNLCAITSNAMRDHYDNFHDLVVDFVLQV